MFIEGDPDREDDDSWLALPVTAVSTAAACPGIMGAGITLTTPNTPALAGLASGTPVRFFEVMELRLHEADGKSWLGARSVSAAEAIQPVLGPLADVDGFALRYLDGAGAVTVNRSAIKSIEVTIRGISDEAVSVGSEGSLSHVQEELVSQIAIRNSLRP